MEYPLRVMTDPNFAARNQTDVLVQERRDILTKPWLGGTVLIGAYAGVLAFVGRSIAEPLPPIVGPVMMLAGAVLGVLSVVLPRSLLGDKQVQARLKEPVDAYRWAKTMRLRGAHLEAFKALPPDEQRLLALTIPFLRPYLVGLALANGVALLGLAYGLMSKTLIEAAPFLLAALALNAWHYPRLTGLIDRGRKLDRGDEEEQALALLNRLDARQKRLPVDEQEPPPASPPRKSVSRVVLQHKPVPQATAQKSAARAQPQRPSRTQGPTKR
jgi:hypothetical protein